MITRNEKIDLVNKYVTDCKLIYEQFDKFIEFTDCSIESKFFKPIFHMMDGYCDAVSKAIDDRWDALSKYHFEFDFGEVNNMTVAELIDRVERINEETP